MKNNPKKEQMWDPVSNINIMCSRGGDSLMGFKNYMALLNPIAPAILS